DVLWERLALGNDARSAYFAQAVLASHKDRAVEFLAPKLRAPRVKVVDEVRRLVPELGAETYEARERATKQLSLLGRDAAIPVRPALAEARDPEIARRLQRVLELADAHKDDPLPPLDLRVLRSVQVLERIGTPEAKGLLEEEARGPAFDRTTQE